MIRSIRIPVASCLPFLLVAGLFLAGCGKDEKGGASETAKLPASGLPESYWLAAAPAVSQPVAEVREKAKTGDSVVVTGRVGGAKEPFTSGVAAFTIVDAVLPPCKDECETPWDYCCEPVDKLTKHTVTIEF